MHDFLFGLVDAHDFERGLTMTSFGDDVVELSDGVHGEIFGRDGWIALFGDYKEVHL